jgi:hypothetical protein
MVGIFKMKTACSSQIVISIYHIKQNDNLEDHYGMLGWQSGQGPIEERETAHFCETVNKNDINKMWDHKLQGPNHIHPILGQKAKGIRRIEAAVMKTVNMLKSCRNLHKFAMKKQIYPVELRGMHKGKTPWPQEGCKK